MNHHFNAMITGDNGIIADGARRTGFIEGTILLGLTSAGLSGAALGITTTALTALVTIGSSIGMAGGAPRRRG